MTDRKLDALVAKKVMGWKQIKEEDSGPEARIGEFTNTRLDGVHLLHPDERHDGAWWPWSPSTEIEDAWEVVEKLRDRWVVEITTSSKPVEKARARIIAHGDDVAYVMADTVPRAICLAALKAIGVEA